MNRLKIISSFSLSMLALLFGIGEVSGDVVANDTNLPPMGDYINLNNDSISYSTFSGTVTLSNFTFTFELGLPPVPFGPDESRDFSVELTGDLTGSPNFTFIGFGTAVAFGKAGNTTGTFDMELQSLSLNGGSGVLLRESPSLPSLGEATVTDIGGGMYRISSFFDVFTELSLDGGMTWTPQSSGQTLITAVPESTHIWLLATGLLLFMSANTRARFRHRQYSSG